MKEQDRTEDQNLLGRRVQDWTRERKDRAGEDHSLQGRRGQKSARRRRQGSEKGIGQHVRV